MENHSKQDGFTLIEVIIALFILSVAILGAASMQTTAIYGNNSASQLSGAATYGEDQLETLINLPINDVTLTDVNNAAPNGGVTGLDNTDGVGRLADGTRVVNDDFTVFWNVADNYPIFGMKSIRVHTRRTDYGGVVKTVTQDFTRMGPL